MEINQVQIISTQQRQELQLSQQQIQALNLLIAPIMELRHLINQEMEVNPVLEMDPPQEEISYELAEERLIENAFANDNYNSNSDINYRSADMEAKREHFLNSLASTSSFEENLHTQLAMLDLTGEQISDCELIISEIDSYGYITSSNQELADLFNISLNRIKKAIATIQKLEPFGIAARNLTERLLIQLENKGQKNSITYNIVKNHLEDLAANKLPLICKKNNISIEHLQQIIHEIKLLQPSLDNSIVNPAQYVQEEVIIHIINNELVVEILNKRLPTLRISPYYKKMLDNPKLSSEDRRFIKQKITNAIDFMKKIDNRQSTIEKVANLIVKYQRAFFFKGEQALVPLTMSQIADELGFHETTISRTVSNKYLKCKFGTIALRKFFTGSGTIKTTNGAEEIAADAIKNKIKILVDKENKLKPLSDDKIVTLLANENIQIARRTVAKYRDALGIASTSRRRQYN